MTSASLDSHNDNKHSQEEVVMMQTQPANLFERAFKKLVPYGLEAVSGRRSVPDIMSLDADLPEADLERVREWVDNCLDTHAGQVEARNRAAMLGRMYLKLSRTGKVRFLGMLAEEYGIDDAGVEVAISGWQHARNGDRARTAHQLRKALEPSHNRLLKQFTGVPSGVKFLVDMREELLELKQEYATLESLEADLKELLATWFDVGLLQLEEISWNSSAALLEKLIAYEAVHEIKSWSDLKNRLDSDRRCFAFMHPNMPDEPLIFVEVALVNGLAGSVQKLLDEQAPTQDIGSADTAIFYSISNAQPGLAGISFGNFLIKEVVKKLSSEFPQLKQFATLSPIPGFAKWLEHCAPATLCDLPGGEQWLSLPAPREVAVIEASDSMEIRQEALTKLAAAYLCMVKKRGARALDPVAHFHLSNGAQVARLNWMGDVSQKGLRQSAGMMVNYLYELPKIEQRSEQYTSEGVVAQSSAIKKLLK
ncbi:malonyl-CoA decarboxylase [Marinobacterium alkalitolerans]|nr:malonyl-CoA decarboxylase [Marinobacterium alkalitolerans]